MNDRPWIAHYDKGVPATLDYPEEPLFHFLERSAQLYPLRACTIFKDATISFKEMNELTDRIAAALVEMGIKKGDRIGIFMPNSPQFIIAYFGILKAGGVVVATNPLYTPPEIAYQASDSGLEILFVMTNNYQTIKSIQPNTKIKRLIVTNLNEALPSNSPLLFTLGHEKNTGSAVDEGLADGDVWMKDLLAKYQHALRPSVDVGPDDTACFQYSGGTTGISKCVVVMHRNLVANTLQFKSWLVTMKDGREILLMAIPMYHVYGMVAGLSYAINLGATMVIIPNARDIPDLLRNINKYHPTNFPGVPTLYNAINNHPDVRAGKINLKSIKVCISGSAPLLRETKEKFEQLSGGKVFEGYGLSEAPTATHINPLLGINKTGSIGLPIPDVESRIISLEDGETEMPPGEIGELVIRGPQVMKSYYNMLEETSNSLRRLKDGRIWLFTGDIARMDEDGYFYIVDRKKELIKPGGFEVWPREVEEAIAAYPKVLEVGVAGIPDPYRGETVKAWIVLKPGEAATVDEIKAFCRERLAPYKVPTHYEFRKELPKTTVGKILRRELVRQHKETESQKT